MSSAASSQTRQCVQLPESNGMDAPTRNGIDVPKWKCHRSLELKRGVVVAQPGLLTNDLIAPPENGVESECGEHPVTELLRPRAVAAIAGW